MIRNARQDEAEDIPSKVEIENSLYVEKYIEDIEEDDQHIKIRAIIEDITSEKILYPMCPNCNKGITQSEDGYICDVCGEKIEQPNYLMIIAATLQDDTGSIRATFFRKQAEALIDTTTEDVIKIFEETADESSMSSRLEDRIGHEVTLIADANYDEYNEDITLNVNRVIIVV